MEQTNLICMSCLHEIEGKPAIYYKHTICQDCYGILKKSPVNCTSQELRILANFLIFWAGLKYELEMKEVRRQKRIERKKFIQ